MHPVDRAVLELAARRHGVVTTAQLAAAGMHRRALARRVGARLAGAGRGGGSYRVGPIVAERGEEMAAVLATGGILSHHTAADLWGIRPHHGAIHITVTGPARRSRPGLAIHRSLSLNAAVHQGLPLTTPTRTIHDLATCLAQHELDRAVEQAQILPASDPRRSPPTCHAGAARRSRTALDHRGPAHPLRGRAAAARPHQPSAACRGPETNVYVEGYEVDVFWPDQRLIVEVDGYAYHSTRQAFERDRARDAALQAAGYRVVRFTWRQITHEPHAVSRSSRG